MYQTHVALSRGSIRDEHMDVDTESVPGRSKTPPIQSDFRKRAPKSPLPARELAHARVKPPFRMGRTPSDGSNRRTSSEHRNSRGPVAPPPQSPEDSSEDELAFNSFQGRQLRNSTSQLGNASSQSRDTFSHDAGDMSLGDLRTTREAAGAKLPGREYKAQRVPVGQPTPVRVMQASSARVTQAASSRVGQASSSRDPQPSTSSRNGQQASSSRPPVSRIPRPPSLRRPHTPEDDHHHDSLAAELHRASSDDDPLESGVLTSFGQRSKRRGFLAHGGAGGTPVFMGVGYVQGAEDTEDEQIRYSEEVPVPLQDEDEDDYRDGDAYQSDGYEGRSSRYADEPEEDDEDAEEWEAQEARKKWKMSTTRPPTPPKQKARGRGR